MSYFFARLLGRNEVPPVVTNARGEAYFGLNPQKNGLEFKLIVRDIENLTVAHIHLGKPGENGDVVAFLFGPMTKPASMEAAILTGVITRYDLVGPLAGRSLADLLRHIQLGNAYVNVHTTQNPNGEIRGQIFIK